LVSIGFVVSSLSTEFGFDDSIRLVHLLLVALSREGASVQIEMLALFPVFL